MCVLRVLRVLRAAPRVRAIDSGSRWIVQFFLIPENDFPLAIRGDSAHLWRRRHRRHRAA